MIISNGAFRQKIENVIAKLANRQPSTVPAIIDDDDALNDDTFSKTMDLLASNIPAGGGGGGGSSDTYIVNLSVTGIDPNTGELIFSSDKSFSDIIANSNKVVLAKAELPIQFLNLSDLFGSSYAHEIDNSKPVVLSVPLSQIISDGAILFSGPLTNEFDWDEGKRLYNEVALLYIKVNSSGEPDWTAEPKWILIMESEDGYIDYIKGRLSDIQGSVNYTQGLVDEGLLTENPRLQFSWHTSGPPEDPYFEEIALNNGEIKTWDFFKVHQTGADISDKESVIYSKYWGFFHQLMKTRSKNRYFIAINMGDIASGHTNSLEFLTLKEYYITDCDFNVEESSFDLSSAIIKVVATNSESVLDGSVAKVILRKLEIDYVGDNAYWDSQDPRPRTFKYTITSHDVGTVSSNS